MVERGFEIGTGSFGPRNMPYVSPLSRGFLWLYSLSFPIHRLLCIYSVSMVDSIQYHRLDHRHQPRNQQGYRY